jgi:hypothetical protein
MNHYINRCSCGVVISQCRCGGVKTETVVKNGCEDCIMKENQSGARLTWQQLSQSQRIRLTSDVGVIKAGTNGTVKSINHIGSQTCVVVQFDGQATVNKFYFDPDERNDDSDLFEDEIFTTRVLTKDSGLVVIPVSYTGEILTLTVNDRAYAYRVPPEEWGRISKLLGYNVGRGLAALRKFLIREDAAILYNYFDPEEMIQRVVDGEDPEKVLSGEVE